MLRSAVQSLGTLLVGRCLATVCETKMPACKGFGCMQATAFSLINLLCSVQAGSLCCLWEPLKMLKSAMHRCNLGAA